MHEITTGTVSATVVIPDIENGAGQFPAAQSQQRETDQPVPPATTRELDTEPLARAVVHYLRGEGSESLRILLAAAEQCKTPDLLAALGYVQTELGQHGAAAETYGELTQQSPAVAEAWFQWGFNLYKLGRTAEALERFDKAASLRSDWIETPLARSICHLKLKQYTEAFEHVDECLAMDPSYKAALFSKAVIFHIQWEFDQAFALYRQIIEEQDPNCIEALMNLITLGLQQKKYEVVRKYSEQLIALQPGAVLAVEGIGIAAFNEGDFHGAWQQYSRLVELAPDQVAHWLNLGVACERRGMLPDAVRAFIKACQMRPDSIHARSYLGGALWKSGELARARISYEEAVVRWPEREDFTLSLAQILEALGNLEAGEKVCRAFCGRDSEKRQVWFRLGYLQFKRGRWDDAISSYERALSLKADWPDAEVDLALALYKAEQYERSEAVLLRLLEREPEHMECLRGLATVTLAVGRHEEALALHQKLLELGEPDAEIFYNCGVLSHNLNNAKQAVDYYRQALDLQPDFPEALLNLGHALSDSGSREDATASWISAVELKPEFARGFFRRT
ncbi:MAG TPA: tetratricopeptide repeat protein [Bryobacteraceae bacterium]|nr:tetratricopeptide repeat protein [Bryobacteraceae bacterium]